MSMPWPGTPHFKKWQLQAAPGQTDTAKISSTRQQRGGNPTQGDMNWIGSEGSIDRAPFSRSCGCASPGAGIGGGSSSPFHHDGASSLASRRAVLLHALDTVDCLVAVCGGFLATKVAEDLWPLLKVCPGQGGGKGVRLFALLFVFLWCFIVMVAPPLRC